MDRNKLLMLAAALSAVVVVAGGFFLGISPKLQAVEAAHTQTATAETQNVTLTAGIGTLRSQFSKLDSLKAQLAGLSSSVPDDADSSSLIREYDLIASKTGTKVVGLTFKDAVSYTPPVATAAAGDGTATASPSASASAPASPTPTATATTPIAPAAASNPLITAANFSAIPVTVEIRGSYAEALSFMQGLHDGSRLFLVTSLTSAVGGDSTTSTDAGATATGPQVPNDWTIGGYIYALADATTTQQSQQTSTSTAAGTTTPTDGSSSDTAAGK